VPWWPEEGSHPTLYTLLVHMIAETPGTLATRTSSSEFADLRTSL